MRDQVARSSSRLAILWALLLNAIAPPASAAHDPVVTFGESAPIGLHVHLRDLRPRILAPGELVTARVLLQNDRDEAVEVETLHLLVLSPDEKTVLEILPPEAPAPSEIAPEVIAPRGQRLLTRSFRAVTSRASFVGRWRLAALARVRSSQGIHLSISPAREITVARLRMHHLTVFPTVLPDCQGATAVGFELEIHNVTFNPVDDAQLLYELRERGSQALLASGRLQLGRLAAGERWRIRSVEPVAVPTPALIPGRRLVLDFLLQPEALAERRFLVIGTGADVKVEDVSIAPPDQAPGDSILPGETVALGFTLINRGNQQGTSPMLEVRLSARAGETLLRVEPDTIRLPNVALAPCGGSLRIGVTSEVPSNIPAPQLFIPPEAEEGEAIVQFHVGRTAEEATTDTDEEPPRASFHIDLPNLRLLDASVPPEILLGQSASLRFRVANVRDHPHDRAPAPAGVRVRAELIQKGRQLAQAEFRTRRPLEAGRSELPPGDFALRVPAQAEEGPALVRLEVDPPTEERPRGDVRESNEADNTVELPIQLKTPLPDLVVEAARLLAPGDPPTLVIGAPTALFFLIANRGEGAADPATHEITLAFTITIGPFPLQLHAPLRTVETPRLGRGRFTPFLVTLSVPPVVQLPGLLLPIPIPPGPAMLRITADSRRSVEETNEDNNTTQIPVVLVPPPSTANGSTLPLTDSHWKQSVSIPPRGRDHTWEEKSPPE
ncbi:hypothetical protein HRbin08_01593 [bacterium HR08]|nr:hypothetical protein HRbin08_01593 [bacterium HR08]